MINHCEKKLDRAEKIEKSNKILEANKRIRKISFKRKKYIGKMRLLKNQRGLGIRILSGIAQHD
jgi:hypothetical protein